MSISSKKVKNAFTANRAEELGLDVWCDFVVPLFYEELNILDATKTRRVTGGRGSGKTMLLRYLSHHSQFSISRPAEDEFNINSIGLYWRADTNFLTMFNKQGISEEYWVKLFKHYMLLVLALETLASLTSIAKSNYSGITSEDLVKIDFSELKDFGELIPSDFLSLSKYLKKQLRECESAVHNPREIEGLKLLPDSFLTAGLIDIIKQNLKPLVDTSFCVFVDEYENLLEYQQKTINTKIKHSQSPLIYHVAMKKNGMETSKTLGGESIQGIADYRSFDLDELLLKCDFDVFCAELFLSRVYPEVFGGKVNEYIDLDMLRNKERIKERRSLEYRKKVLCLVEAILPGQKYEEMARAALNTSAHLNKLKKDIESILSKDGLDNNIKAIDFFVSGFERASIIVPALLSRKSNTPVNVMKEFKAHVAGDKSNFDAWIANNFVGCYLQMFRAYDRVCPFYSGFQTYVALSRGNIRHFYELCNAAMIRSEISKENLTIDINTQVLAAKAASEEILNEAPTYGQMGGRIRAFIYNLGHIFEFSHMRKTQSESEVNHFSIKGGFSSLNDDDAKFLSEAEKWGVLYQEKSTKNKDKSSRDNSDWILNPIYSPFFFISYRKKRKLEVSIDEFRVLHSGTEGTRVDLEALYKSKWELEDLDQPRSHTLF